VAESRSQQDLVKAISGLRWRIAKEVSLIALRLEGLTRKYTLVIDDSVIGVNVPNRLTMEWVIPRELVSWIGDEDVPAGQRTQLSLLG
jgi:hypothetical protein